MGSLTTTKRAQGGMRVIFVFGSNLAGRHGAGSALAAVRAHGAIYGQGVGLQGNSYAIPTKDANLHRMPLAAIKPYVDDFLQFAREHPELQFRVVRIGCGLAGYSNKQIAPMFVGATSNVWLDQYWRVIIREVEEPRPQSPSGRDQSGG